MQKIIAELRLLQFGGGMRIFTALAILVIGSIILPQAVAAKERAIASLNMGATGLIDAEPVAPAALKKLLQENRRVLVFDTRSKIEFDVSHIPGARRLDPATHVDAFARRFRQRAKGRVFVFYCTIGERSTMMAEGAAEQLRDQGALTILVLDSGIIGWANAGLAMVDRRGPTQFVHVFDETKVKHLKRPQWARFD